MMIAYTRVQATEIEKNGQVHELVDHIYKSQR